MSDYIEGLIERSKRQIIKAANDVALHKIMMCSSCDQVANIAYLTRVGLLCNKCHIDEYHVGVKDHGEEE